MDLAANTPSPAAPSQAADAPRVDCATLVTPADVAKACGGRNVEIVVSEHEGKNTLGTCWRSLTEPGAKVALTNVFMDVFSDSAAAESWAKAKIVVSRVP